MINLQSKKMTQHLTRMASDSVLAGSASLTTGLMTTPNPTDLQTVYIPLITGIIAPLVKELIVTLRETRRRRKERKCEQKEK